MSVSENQNRPDPAPGLPVVIDAAAPRPSLQRSQTNATFISQLLAARDNLPPQRQRRQGSVEGALGAYRAGASIAVRRLPQGYRKTVVA